MRKKRVEGFNFDTRKNVVQYDNVINRHRKVVYAMRRKILEGEDITAEIKELFISKAAELAELPSKNNEKFCFRLLLKSSQLMKRKLRLLAEFLTTKSELN